MVTERERSSTTMRRERAKSKKRMRAQLKMHSRTCIIDPRMSKYMAYWDTVTMLAILFTALVTPYEIAYLPMAISAISSTNEGSTNNAPAAIPPRVPCSNQPR